MEYWQGQQQYRYRFNPIQQHMQPPVQQPPVQQPPIQQPTPVMYGYTQVASPVPPPPPPPPPPPGPTYPAPAPALAPASAPAQQFGYSTPVQVHYGTPNYTQPPSYVGSIQIPISSSALSNAQPTFQPTLQPTLPPSQALPPNPAPSVPVSTEGLTVNTVNTSVSNQEEKVTLPQSGTPEKSGPLLEDRLKKLESSLDTLVQTLQQKNTVQSTPSPPPRKPKPKKEKVEVHPVQPVQPIMQSKIQLHPGRLEDSQEEIHDEVNALLSSNALDVSNSNDEIVADSEPYDDGLPSPIIKVPNDYTDFKHEVQLSSSRLSTPPAGPRRSSRIKTGIFGYFFNLNYTEQ